MEFQKCENTGTTVGISPEVFLTEVPSQMQGNKEQGSALRPGRVEVQSPAGALLANPMDTSSAAAHLPTSSSQSLVAKIHGMPDRKRKTWLL